MRRKSLLEYAAPAMLVLYLTMILAAIIRTMWSYYP